MYIVVSDLYFYNHYTGFLVSLKIYTLNILQTYSLKCLSFQEELLLEAYKLKTYSKLKNL